jgi:hypothetical protein
MAGSWWWWFPDGVAIESFEPRGEVAGLEGAEDPGDDLDDLDDVFFFDSKNRMDYWVGVAGCGWLAWEYVSFCGMGTGMGGFDG